MRLAQQFLNDADDCQWLFDTHLRGTPLPEPWIGFGSFVLKGNEDAPHSVDLYLSIDPLYTDAFYRVTFGDPIVACEHEGD